MFKLFFEGCELFFDLGRIVAKLLNPMLCLLSLCLEAS